MRIAEEHANQRELIYHISSLVNSTLDLGEILQVAVREMVSAFGVEHSGIFLFDAKKEAGQIVAEYPSRLFTTRAATGSMGLGLSVCYGIVGRHGGRIWVESTPGEGARFFVELPVSYSAEEGSL